MHYHLDFLESLAENDFFTSPNIANVTTVIEEVNQEVTRIIRAMKKDIAAMPKQGHAKRYLRQHRMGVITLMNNLEARFAASGDSMYSAPQRDLFEKVYDGIARLKTGIDTAFTHASDIDMIIPVREFEHELKTINENVKLFHELMSIRNLDDAWRRVLNEPVTYFDRACKTKCITRRIIVFMDRYLLEFMNVIDENNNGSNQNMRFVDFVIDVNLNTTASLYSAIEVIRKNEKEMDSTQGRIEYLLTLAKRINAKAVRSDVSFNVSMPPLGDQILEWLERELFYLREKINIKSERKVSESGDFSLLINLSVSQLACLVRGLIDAKIIMNNNISEVIRFLSQFVKTKRAEQISAESFRIKYYNIEESTRTTVDETLRKIIQTLRKENGGR